jgi:hypothetical protein
MKNHTLRSFAILAAVLSVSTMTALAQYRGRIPAGSATVTDTRGANRPSKPLAINQTRGFGADRILTFTYTQQFDCVVQPFDDRNYIGRPAAVDPFQFNQPQCQIGAPSTIDPAGLPVARTDKLFVLVPFFETDPKAPAFSSTVARQVKKLFGFVPDAFKINPGVAVQCPEPGPPISQRDGQPGTCTMHPTQVDLGPVLTALHKLPPKTILNLPLVNHDHILDNAQVNQSAEWWQVVVVLVTDRKVWPDACGCRGITSLAKLRFAQAHNQASADVPSNFFLFFASKEMGKMKM